MNGTATLPARALEDATKPVFTTRFAHELQLVLDSLRSHAIPCTSVAHDPWSQKWSAELASHETPPDVRWTILVPPGSSHPARTLIESLPVSSDQGVEHAVTQPEVRRGTLLLVSVIVALLLAFLVIGFLASLR